MLNRKNFPGLDGFVWWTGVIEDRVDPLKVGRVLVRIYGWHDENKALIPTGELKWAQPVFPTNVSNDTYVCKEGDTVFGFYMDGDSAQFPFFFGRFPDIPAIKYPATVGFSDPGSNMGERPVEVKNRIMIDGEGVIYTNDGPKRYPDPLGEPTTSRLARNENLDKTPIPFIKENTVKDVELAGGGSWNELTPAYQALYPYNDSRQTESGHYFDTDDTRDQERIQMLHRTGTSQEIRKSGTSTFKHCKHYYEIVHGSKRANYRGNLQVTTERWTRFKSKGKAIAEINADAEINVGGKLTIGSMGDLLLTSATQITISAPIIMICGSEVIIDGNREEDGMTMNILGGSVCGRPNTVDYVGNPEAPISETSKNTEDKKSKLDELLALITAPTGGGRGELWEYTINGQKMTLLTHHATGDGLVLEYLWCIGATSVLKVYTGQVFNRPSNFVCQYAD